MSVSMPFYRGQRMWSSSVDRSPDIFLVDSVRDDTPAGTRARNPGAYVDPMWMMNYVIVRIRRPGRPMALVRRIQTHALYEGEATPAGAP